MLVLFNKDTQDFDNYGVSALDEAINVHMQREINGNHCLLFDYPLPSEKYQFIKEGMLVKSEEQLYRISRIVEDESRCKASIIANHVYRDTEQTHIQYYKKTSEHSGDNFILGY